MFKDLLKRGAKAGASDSAKPAVLYEVREVGLAFPQRDEADLVTMRGRERHLAAYLLQLANEGYLRQMGEEFLLPWEQLFSLLGNADHADSIWLLGLPMEMALRPSLASEGGLSDAGFKVIVRGWRRPDGSNVAGALNRIGAIFSLDGVQYRLPDTTWRLLSAIKNLAARQQTHPGEETNQLGWSSIHKQAAGASFDGFLEKTIVLRPESLRIKLRKSEQEGLNVTEVFPTFEGEPDNWLSAFDRLSTVPDHYAIPGSNGGITHILVSPEVKTVLQEIRAMPARRVAGDRALRFLRNPYACLGDDAVKVIDQGQFEKDREAAGFAFLKFSLHPEVDDSGRIAIIVLRLAELSLSVADRINIVFAQPGEFAPFVRELEAKLAAGLPCGFWKGYELELSDFDRTQFEGAKALLTRWQSEVAGNAFDAVLDLSQYGSRVIGIGLAETPSSPYLMRVSGQEWLPEALLSSMGLDGALLAKWDTDDVELLEEFKRSIDQARDDGSLTVVVPGIGATVPIRTADAIAIAWTEKLGAQKPRQPPSQSKVARSVLQIDHNIEELSYVERRANALQLPANAAPLIPRALLSNVDLRDHQKCGVTWLQHLFSCSPHSTSGCLLADDMGLGKTLQLLTFIASYLEQPDSSAPVLIVAPVSLLDNWESEIERFFAPGFASVLKLYGTELSAVKFSKSELSQELKDRGIFTLLRPNWRNGKQIVLTTYETMRDQEFSLARQHWAIMVCDEAQKIKNPASLVSQAARAIQARFRIACTGTPVENSLTDLWCLFEFIQPGLLGALNEFGRKYRPAVDGDVDQNGHGLDELRALVDPQVLRRLKSDVAKDLPEKIETKDCMALPISKLQLRLYKNELGRFQAGQGDEAPKSDNQKTTILGLLHTMKMICAHPHSLYPEGDLLDVSPKMRWLIKCLAEIRTRGEKVIIFTELRDIQRALQFAIIDEFKIPVIVINGDTNASSERGPSRQSLINDFQSQLGFGVIILSTSAVGFGVNVQAANHVVHFTRCWNPAKEDQATDRAYRIGQTKNVYVYYPTISGGDFESFEQKLHVLLSKKRALACDMLNGVGDINMMELIED